MKIQLYSIRTETKALKRTLVAASITDRNHLMGKIMGQPDILTEDILPRWQDFAEERAKAGEYHSWDSHEVDVPVRLVMSITNCKAEVFASHEGITLEKFDFDVWNEDPDELDARYAAAVEGMQEVAK